MDGKSQARRTERLNVDLIVAPPPPPPPPPPTPHLLDTYHTSINHITSRHQHHRTQSITLPPSHPQSKPPSHLHTLRQRPHPRINSIFLFALQPLTRAIQFRNRHPKRTHVFVLLQPCLGPRVVVGRVAEIDADVD